MQNKNYRRIAIIVSTVLLGVIMFGAGYAMGATDTANFIFNRMLEYFEDLGVLKDLSMADLMKYYLSR